MKTERTPQSTLYPINSPTPPYVLPRSSKGLPILAAHAYNIHGSENPRGKSKTTAAARKTPPSRRLQRARVVVYIYMCVYTY